MCGQDLTPKCRSRQLFDAAEEIIDKAREASKLSASASFADVAEKMAGLKQAVAVFDRLNRGI